MLFFRRGPPGRNPSLYQLEREWSTACSSCTAGRIYGVPMVGSTSPPPRDYDTNQYRLVVEKFDPDRFLDQRVRQYLTPNPFIFLPFNAGPRICLGQQFAYHESSFFLVRLLQQFSSIWLDLDAQPPEGKPNPDWQLDPDAGERKLKEKVWPASHLTAFIKGGLWVKMSKAEK